MPKTARTPVFNRYELIEELGEGAFGAVYKARHKVIGHFVALKVLPPALRKDTETRERFQREASTLGKLHHPHVVQIHDADIEQSFPYLAMEFVEGQDLQKVLQKRKRLSVDEVIQLGVEMAYALDHVHSQGLVHRDVKPSNIMMGLEGHAKLTDFGIAFAATLPRITMGIIGTPEYMSPEQIDGKAVDGRSYLYSLGVVLYKCLAGVVPFPRQSESLTEMYALLKRIQEETMPLIPRPDVPRWLSDTVARCLSKKPEDRYESGAELAHVLTSPSVSDQPKAETVTQATPLDAAAEIAGRVPASRPTPIRRKKPVFIAVVIAAFIGLGSLAYSTGLLTPSQEETGDAGSQVAQPVQSGDPAPPLNREASTLR